MNFELVLKTALSNLRYGRRRLIRTEEAIALARDWCSRLPMKYDLLVGVPRTGLMFASFMSIELGVPLSTPELLPNFWASSNDGPIRNILVVEDMTSHGSLIYPAQKKAQECFPNALVHIGALYSPEPSIRLDSYGAKITGSSITEWDFLDRQAYQNIAVDMDGVLCQDCPPALTEEQFIVWLESAIPYLTPSYQIGSIITSRLEKYRKATEQWLKGHGVKYHLLFMDPSKNLSDRDLIGWKVHCVNWRKPDVFIESDDQVAQEVHWRTGVPVICISTMRLYS